MGMKILNGAELAGFIKERQAHQVRGLRQAEGIQPKLVIIRTNPDPVVDTYMHLKQGYGRDILVDVDVLTCDQEEAAARIQQLNADESVHGIIVQLPLPNPQITDHVLNTVNIQKDVDGLAEGTHFDAPTPVAINWLLVGHNVDLRGKQLLIVGNGRLVGAPLTRMWRQSELNPIVVDKTVTDLSSVTREADVIVTATGVPGLITAAMVRPDAIIVDAGVATDSNGLVGDVANDVRELPNIIITPTTGGVGPLTVCALFDNVIRAAQVSKVHST